MTIGSRGVVLTCAVAALALLAGPASAATRPYAPLGRAGPALRVPQGALRASLACTPGVSGANRNPILLVPGTTLDPGTNISWNYERAFRAMQWPYGTVKLPFHTLGDMQTAAEYLVNALRTMARTSGRRVDVLGYSQGGVIPRWAVRFWPDTRLLVGDLVALAPTNHGTLLSDAICRRSCPPAVRQQAPRARFVRALNSGRETFAGIDYTVVYTRHDEVVLPSSSSWLHTGAGRIANVALQDVCPGDSSEHLAIGSYDAVGYALAVDAFTHPGTAGPARIDRAVCEQPFQPGVSSATFGSDYAGYLGAIRHAQQGAPAVHSEPPLRCYVLASCRRHRRDHQRGGGGASR